MDPKGRKNIPGIIDDPEDNRPDGKASKDWQAWPVLNSLPAATDTDGDGIPDSFETQIGLDPNNPADGAMRHRQSGFTFLEIYLNALVGDIMQAESADGVIVGQ